MASNRLAGAGPQAGSGGADGPSPMLSGTLGASPQASPQTGPNMLSQAGAPGAPVGMPAPGAGPQNAPVVPPSPEKLKEALTKQSVMMATLKQLLSKSDLQKKDILGAAGEIVADGVMSPFDAAKYLSDFPTDDDPLTLRKWVATHYANAAKNFQIVSSMFAAHGNMVRQQGAPSMQGATMQQVPPMQTPPPQAMPSTQFSAMQ